MIDKSSPLLYDDAKMAYVSTPLAAHMLSLSEANTVELLPQENPKKWVAGFYKTFYASDSKSPVVEPEFVSIFAQKGFMRTSQKRLLSTSFIAVSFRPCPKAVVRHFKNYIMSL